LCNVIPAARRGFCLICSSLRRSRPVSHAATARYNEEVGSRAAIFDLEGFGGDKLSYVTWLLSQCLGTKTKAAATDSINAVPTEDAI
jgi:hypothetical protein